MENGIIERLGEENERDGSKLYKPAIKTSNFIFDLIFDKTFSYLS